MNIYILFGKLPESYPGQFTPDPLRSYSQNMYDGDEEALMLDVEKDKEKFKGEYPILELVILQIDDNKIDEILHKKVPMLKAEIIR